MQALAGVSLQVRRGTVLGLLGPNGAGKTTFVRVLATLLKPDSATARVAGLDVVHEARLRSQIGLAGQYAAVDENLTGLENLTMVGRLYGMDRASARERGRELLERFELTEASGRARPRPTPGACAAGLTWPRRWWPSRRSCSSTSPPPPWIPVAG